MATEMMMPVYFCLHLLLWAGGRLTLNGLWARYEHGTVLAARGGALGQPLEAAAPMPVPPPLALTWMVPRTSPVSGVAGEVPS